MSKHTKKSGIIIGITLSDLKVLAAGQFEIMQTVATENAYCVNCGITTMQPEGWAIWLNRLGDVLWDGSCQVCKGKVTRYLESGSDSEFLERAMDLREMKIEILEDYEERPIN